MSVLIAGWFSFADGLATTGDLHAAELVHRWLTGAGYPCEVAIVPSFGNGIDWRSADPAAYTHVVFVCGPFGQYPGELQFLSRFAECCLIGINLSMLIELDRWNPFDLLFERDKAAWDGAGLEEWCSRRGNRPPDEWRKILRQAKTVGWPFVLRRTP